MYVGSWEENGPRFAMFSNSLSNSRTVPEIRNDLPSQEAARVGWFLDVERSNGHSLKMSDEFRKSLSREDWSALTGLSEPLFEEIFARYGGRKPIETRFDSGSSCSLCLIFFSWHV